MPHGPGPVDVVASAWVVHDGRVLLIRHRKLATWLPPGGHVDVGERPDRAAVREVAEETGVACRLVDPRGADAGAGADGGDDYRDEGVERLVHPLHVQLEDIFPGHQHFDLVYVAVTDDPTTTLAADEVDGVRWASAPDLDEIPGLKREVRDGAREALAVVNAAGGR